jgi:hypothetical protein
MTPRCRALIVRRQLLWEGCRAPHASAPPHGVQIASHEAFVAALIFSATICNPNPITVCNIRIQSMLRALDAFSNSERMYRNNAFLQNEGVT